MEKKKIMFSLIFVVITLAGCGEDAKAPVDWGRGPKTRTRVGIYDSRAVAVAFAHSDWNEKRLQPKMAEMKKAKAIGDTKKIKALDQWGKAQQAKLHRQGFSTAPVDDILEHIKDNLPQITKDANVAALV